MASQPLPFLTPDQYLAIDRAAEFRSEYLDGEMFAMAGSLEDHSRVVGNLAAALRSQLRGRCRYFATDSRLFVPATGLYAYPDLMVICGQIAYAGDRQDIFTNPQLIIEVLSRGTATYDRGNKAVHYRSIPTLTDYLTVSPREVRVEQWTRRPEGAWLLRTFTSVEDILTVDSIGVEIRLADAYEDV
jgi:Uma2 family endonuclease